MKKRIAVLFGGVSSEYDVSLASSCSVIKSIDTNKYDVILIGITKEGDFYLYDGDIDKIEKDEWFGEKCQKITFSTNRSDKGIILMDTKEVIKIDLVFPVLHGQNGEDGKIQALLSLIGIKYVGCDMSSSLLCMDKYLAHELVKMSSILTPNGYLFNKNDNLDYIKGKISNLKFPLFIKPLRAGSSFGITKVISEGKVDSAISLAFEYDDKIIIEENIDGFEVGCAVLGNDDNILLGEVDEIELSTGFFDYDEKYTLKTSKIHVPARIDDKEREKIKKTAIQIYKILGCRDFARIDMFYTKDKKIVFNEVNTIPGFTSHSRYPSMLKEIGLSFEEIVERIIEMGLAR